MKKEKKEKIFKSKVWRSLFEKNNEASFSQSLDREFVSKSPLMQDSSEEDLSRRSFLKLMGASTALTGVGLGGCRRPEEYLVPYTSAPEWVVPGKPLYYTTSMPLGDRVSPLIVTTYEGKPTKLEPNSAHSDSDGVDHFAQASILDLYDSQRSQNFLKNGEVVKKEVFVDELQKIKSSLSKGEKVAFLFGEDVSPTRIRLCNDLKARYPQLEFYSYEALSEEVRRDVWKDVFAQESRVLTDFSRAKRILSFDCDFLGLDKQGGSVKGFYQGRQGNQKPYEAEINPEEMNRLYVVEGNYSLSGGMADHRLRIAPSRVFQIALQVALELQNLSNHSSLEEALRGFPTPNLSSKEKSWVQACVADLYWHRGKSIILGGLSQGKALHRLVVAMNVALDNYGEDRPLLVVKTEERFSPFSSLVQSLKLKEVDTLFLLGSANPVFDVPVDLDFSSLLKGVRVIHLGERVNASALVAQWHIPAAHYLERWGDLFSQTGVYSVIQPMILPLFGGVSDLDILCFLAGEKEDFSSLDDEKVAPQSYFEIRKTAKQVFPRLKWNQIVQEGFAQGSKYLSFSIDGLKRGLTMRQEEFSEIWFKGSGENEYELAFFADFSVWDGRFLQNAWLQEMPDPISKLAWDNVASVSPRTAKKMGIYEDILALESDTAAVAVDGEAGQRKSPMIEISFRGQSLVVPVLVAFGLADDVISLPLGYGQGKSFRKNNQRLPYSGQVGKESGFDTFSLRFSSSPYIAQGARVKNLSERYAVALTQEHHSLYGRALAREISTAGNFSKHLKGVKKQGMDSHIPENISLYQPKGSRVWHDSAKAENLLSDSLHQWAMTVDLNVCTGCNACLLACQAENNIPVVGKEQVAKGREMHWIRMDRYFSIDSHNDFDADNPEMIPQPVACAQCESAPCESVCPVNATVHTDEGLNAMAYNRCIGTRYCANNCPYKARRFNFFDYNKRNPLIKGNLYRGIFGKSKEKEISSLQKNPNVTMRMRGIMEKCTYCVQRLQSAKIRRKQIQREKSLQVPKGSTAVLIKDKDLRVPVDSIRVACQDACPSDAIQFGNLLDGKKARVVRAKNSQRNYDLLSYLGTRPRTSYLARVKNPNLEMPDAPFVGTATSSMH